jgi:hypothetical protein
MNADEVRRTWTAFGLTEPLDTPHLLTREELIARLRDCGVSVTPNDFHNWQYAGAIPYGLPTGVVGQRRTLYPPAMVAVLLRFKALQAEGYRIEQIGKLLRETPTQHDPSAERAVNDGSRHEPEMEAT